MSFIQNAKAECIDFSSALILVCDVGSIPRRSRIMRQALWCLAERNLVEPTVSGHPPYILPADGESQSADQVPTKAIKINKFHSWKQHFIDYTVCMEHKYELRSQLVSVYRLEEVKPLSAKAYLCIEQSSLQLCLPSSFDMMNRGITPLRGMRRFCHDSVGAALDDGDSEVDYYCQQLQKMTNVFSAY